jgi:hypothetical protein
MYGVACFADASGSFRDDLKNANGGELPGLANPLAAI